MLTSSALDRGDSVSPSAAEIGGVSARGSKQSGPLGSRSKHGRLQVLSGWQGVETLWPPSVPSLCLLSLAFAFSFPHPPAPGFCRAQTEGASGVEVLLAFRPAPCSQSSICSARFAQTPLVMSFRRSGTHQSCALVSFLNPNLAMKTLSF